MKSRKKAISSVLLALILVVSGMCFEYIKADAFFAAAMEETSYPERITARDSAIVDLEDISTRELSGSRDASYAQYGASKPEQRTLGNKGFSPDFDCVCVSKVSFYFLQRCLAVYIPICGYEHVIQDYIHRVDGKKRI